MSILFVCFIDSIDFYHSFFDKAIKDFCYKWIYFKKLFLILQASLTDRFNLRSISSKMRVHLHTYGNDTCPLPVVHYQRIQNIK